MMRARILVVEDDRVVARDIRQQLERIGHTVVGSTASGEEAVDVAADLQADLVLMDVRVEGAIDGIEAARRIRERHQIQVIYLSANADDETLRRASLTGLSGYLLKPFEESQLRTVVELALHKHAAERRLRESERRYAVTLSSIGDAVIACDERLQVTFINPVASALTGWPAEDAVGRSLVEVFSIINEDSRKAVEDPASKVLRLGTVVGLANHTALVARDGRVIPIDDCASPIIDERGAMTGVVLVFRDITQRRQADEAEALRALNARIDEAVRGSSIGVWVNEIPDGDHTTGRIHVWNLWEHLGYAPHGPGDRASWGGLMHPDDRGPVALAMERYLNGDSQSFEIQLRLRHSDGRYRWFLVRGIVVRDARGVPIRFAGTSVDITDRKLAEEGLGASEHRFRTFVEHATDGFVLYDERGIILDLNGQMCQSLGYTAEELIGQSPLAFSPEMTQPLLDELLRRLEHGEHVALASRHRRKDGSEFPVDIRARQFHDGGRPLIVAVVRDVTEREEAERALRQSEARFRGTFDNAGVGIVHCDLDGRFIDANQSYCDILGYTWEALSSLTYKDVTHPDDVASSTSQFDALVRGELTSFTVEKRYIARSGAVVWGHVTVSLQRDASGIPLHSIAIMRDISEQKRLDADFRSAKAAAEMANRAKDEFLANVSHEIRTPMNAILGLTELVLDTSLGDDQRQLLKIVESAARGLLGIINDLLDFSKIEAGKLELDLADLCLRAALGETLRALATRAHHKRLELVCNVHAGVPDRLVGDVGRLRQVLVNLVGNAIKFTATGEVVVEVERATSSALAEGEVCLRFSVRDTGIGVSRDKQAAIFRAFEQEDTSTTRRYGGTGLGLTISARLIALMGGQLTVESEPGRGSTFSFTARFGQKADSPEAADASPQPLLRDVPALVVDDNGVSRRILDSWLRGWGMDSTAVGDGMAAMDALWHSVARGRPLELVVLDARMPDTDGLTLAARIRERAELAATRIILLTSGERPGDLVRLRDLRIEAHLNKPVLHDELLETVLRCMSRAVGGLPPTTAPSPSTRPPEPASRSAHRLRILVAEDNEFNSRLIEELLARRGHHVQLAGDGSEALRLLDGEQFDLMLLDLHMPEKDGFQVIQAVRERERFTGDHLPVIAVTARSRPADRERVLAAGMDDFLAKPLQASGLWAAIDRVMAAPKASRPLLDRATLLAACGEDEAILAKICSILRARLPLDMAEIDMALRAREAPRLREAAHKLAGMVAAFSTSAGRVASDLEDQAARDDLDEASVLVAELQRMTRELIRLVDGLSIASLRATRT